MSIRLDEMNIDEVEQYYRKIFEGQLPKDEFNRISSQYRIKYEEVYDAHYNLHYKVSGGMGRGFKYTLAILYGWYIEELIFNLISKNHNVLEIEYSGNDAEHNFIFDKENKLIKIAGEKTTNPDFLVTLKDGRRFFIELKTAAAGVFTIKKGNVMQLYKTIATTKIYSIILMIDIINGLYEFKDLNFFSNLHPFVNQRMEGQLCYHFPTPTKPFSNLIYEDFLKDYNDEIYKNPIVLKYFVLNLAQVKNKDLAKIIKKKLAIDNKKEEFEFQKLNHEAEISKIIKECPEAEARSWEELLIMLNNNESSSN